MQIVDVLKKMLPGKVRRFLSAGRRDLRRKLLPFDRVTDFSVLRRVKPYRPAFGWHRGKPVDRYYMERFLSANEDSIRGHVLEVGGNEYTRRFGRERVTRSDVIDLRGGLPVHTIIADLTRCDVVPDEAFDCIICTHTLHIIYDFKAAVCTLQRILRPGGVVLATFPGITQLCPTEMIGGAGDNYWRFSPESARRIFAEPFGGENVEVFTFGNILAAVALLHGLVAAELTEHELNHHDPLFDVTIGVKARKPA